MNNSLENIRIEKMLFSCLRVSVKSSKNVRHFQIRTKREVVVPACRRSIVSTKFL